MVNLSKGAGAMEDYMMASKSVGVIPLALSLVTSFMSAITVLGVPAEILKCGKVLQFYQFESLVQIQALKQCNVRLVPTHVCKCLCIDCLCLRPSFLQNGAQVNL